MKTIPFRKILTLLLLSFIHTIPIAVGAQETPQDWSSPLKLFELSPDSGSIADPLVVTDSTGLVHIFWLVSSDGNRDIYYTVLDDGRWSEPTDILTDVRAFSVTIDKENTIHTIWTRANTLFYSWSPADQAYSPRSWSTPISLEAANLRVHIVTGPDNRLHIGYSAPRGSSVLYMTSEDNGFSWSMPVHVHSPITTNAAMDDIRLAVGSDGVIHLAWTEYLLPDGWPPLGVFYTRSTDGGLTWSTPFTIAGDNYDQMTISLTDSSNVHVAWNGRVGINGRYHRWSSDGGHTWSDVNVISERGGTEGFPNLVVDSNHTLHLATTYSQAWYTTWVDERWIDPVRISGEEALGSYVEEASMALSEGNLLHAVYWVARQHLWYVARQIDAPRIIPATPEPTPISPITVTAPILSPTPEHLTESGQEQISLSTEPEVSFVRHSVTSLALNLLPVFIFIIISFFLLTLRRKL